MEKELFDEFNSNIIESRIVKAWSVTYKGIEYEGTLTTYHEAWGSWEDHNYKIDDHKDLTDEELDELEDYIIDNIN